MPKINITTSDGQLVEVIDTESYNLSSGLHRSELANGIIDAIKLAIRIENSEHS